MANINISFDSDVSVEQQVSFTFAAAIWETVLTENVQINLRVSAIEHLGTDGLAAGSATPIFHQVNYGVYQEYLAQDATSAADQQVVDSLQDGNSFGVAVDGELVDGNSDIMLTRAQAKALGMEEALVLDDYGTTWDRDVIDNANGLDGYIQFNNSLDWHHYNPNSPNGGAGSLDFLTMALHEIGHSLGFVSGLDGLIDTVTQHSGELLTEGVTALDLLRHGNSDGIADLTPGADVGLSLDGGETRLADLESGSEYQASHWQSQDDPIGVMDPTLGYQERINISQQDLTALDILGWDVDAQALNSLDIAAIYNQLLQDLIDAASAEDGGTNDAGGWFQETGEGTSEDGITVEGDLILAGSDGDDIIGGSPLGKDLISGHYGNDLIDGKGGDDILLGNEGDDKVYGGVGADELYGGTGNDQLKGEDDDDSLYGEAGHDVLTGGRGADYLEGGAGRDVLEGDIGDDVLYGDANPNGAPTQQAFWVRIEAEEMRLRGSFRGQHSAEASGGGLVETQQGWGRATTIFNGPSGTYDLVVGYGAGSTANYEVLVRSKQGWQVTTKATHTGQLDSSGTHTISGVTLASGDWLEFRATGDLSFDYLDVRTSGSTLNELHNFVGDQVEHRHIQWAEMTAIDQPGGDPQTTASYTHSGKAGTYNLYANYFDGSAVTSQTTLLLNGQQLHQFTLDENDDANHEQAVGMYVDLKPGDVITVAGQGEGGNTPLNALILEDVASPGADSPIHYLDGISHVQNRSWAGNGYRYHVYQAPHPGVVNLDLSGAYTMSDSWHVSYLLANVDLTVGDSFQATALFTGASGYYDVSVVYYDYEPDNDDSLYMGVGAAEYVFNIDNQEVDRWYADGTERRSPTSQDAYRSSGIVKLDQFDLIELQVTADGTDLGGLRDIIFTPVAAPNAAAAPLDLGSPDSDILRGGGGNDRAYGGGGDDALYGDAGNDSLYGEGGHDHLWGGDGDDVLDGGEGNDSLTAGAGNDVLDGGEGNDSLTAGAGNDVLDGGEGNDSLTAGDGADVAYGGLGNDTLQGDGGNDILYGDEDLNATLSRSGANQDTLQGGDGDDTLYGGQGSDSLYGDAGNDILYGDTGPNDTRTITLWAAQFKDIDTWYASDARQFRYYGTDADHLGIPSEEWHLTQDFNAPSGIQFGNRFALLSVSFGALFASNPDRRERHLELQRWIDTEAGVDYTLSFDEAYGRSLRVLYDGGFTYSYNAGGGTVWGDPVGGEARGGEMLLQMRDDSFEKIYSLDHIPAYDSLDWQTHSLSFTGKGGVQNLAFLVDPITYLDNLKLTSQDLNALGHIHHDVLVGGSGNDQLWGESGNDQLTGTDATARGVGEQDTLTGGVGADWFILGDGQGAYYSTGGDQDYAVITDFTAGEDRLQLYGTWADYQQVVQDGNLLLSYGNDRIAQFTGVTSLGDIADTVFTLGTRSTLLVGTAGDDRLAGTDATARGAGEQDTLTGHGGADTFVLGDVEGAYYSGRGDQDFATITDFTAGVDRVELVGSAANYRQRAVGDTLFLSYGDDRIAQFHGLTRLDEADIVYVNVNQNRAPVAASGSYSTQPNTALRVDGLAKASDVDGDSLTLTAVGDASHGTVVNNGDGTITYTPNADFRGGDRFTYTISDGRGGSDTATVDLAVEPSPSLSVGQSRPTFHGGLSWQSDHNDAENAVLEFDGTDDYLNLDGLKTGGTMTVSALVKLDRFSEHYMPIFDFGWGGSRIQFYVDKNSQTAVLTAPVSTSHGVQYVSQAIRDFWSTDEWIHVAVVSDGNSLELYRNGDSVHKLRNVVLPEQVRAKNYVGAFHHSSVSKPHYFDGQLDDLAVYDQALGAEEVRALTVNLGITATETLTGRNGLDWFQLGNADRAFYAEHGDRDYALITGFEAGLDKLYLHGAAADYQQSVQGGSLWLSYGEELIAQLQSVTALSQGDILYQAKAVNTAPIALDDGGLSTLEDTALTVTVLANDSDADGDVLSIQGVGRAGYGTAVDNGDGTITYTPNADFNGRDYFTYTLSDGKGGFDTARVSVNVTPVEEEVDTLTGTAGAIDTFGLGDGTGAFYAAAGDGDYAVITNFEAGLDQLQLHGSAADYQQSVQNGNVLLSYNNDLVAQLNGVAALDFTNDVVFV
jgi:Ca2+-binding RTX toxin-like protein